MTFSDYVRNKSLHATTLFVIGSNGIGHYIYNGYAYTLKEFEQKFPVTKFPRFQKNQQCVKDNNISSQNNLMY